MYRGKGIYSGAIGFSLLLTELEALAFRLPWQMTDAKED